MGHEAQGGLPREPRQALDVSQRNRLLDQVDPSIAEQWQALRRNSLAPGLVDIHADACPISQRLLDRGYMGNAAPRVTPADLQLENIMPPPREHLFSFGNVRRGIAACQSPGDGQPVMDAPPHHFRGGDLAPLAKRIDKRWFDGTFREVVSLNPLVDRAHCATDPVRIALKEDRSEIGVDRELHTFKAL